MDKVGIVVEGGGMRGMYGTGVLDRFLDENLEFPYCIGVSAGSANLVSFLSKQRGRNYRYYKQHTKNKKYMSLENVIRSGSFFGLEYIYGTLTNGLDAVDYDILLNTQSILKITATRADTAESVYFGNSDIHRDDCRVLMASCAVPAINRPVTIDGIEYFDGGITDTIPFEQALRDGCSKLVVILSRKRGFVKKPENFKNIYSKTLAKYPKIIEAMNNRHELYNKSIEKLNALEAEGRAVIIAPSRDVKISMFGTDPQSLDSLYTCALEDAEDALPKIHSICRSA